MTNSSAYINGDLTSSHHNHLLRIIQNYSDDYNPNAANAASEATSSNHFHHEDANSVEMPLTCKRSASTSVKYSLNTVPHGATSPSSTSLDIIEEDVTPKPSSSILKNKFGQRSNSLDPAKPNSILKRKTFEDAGFVTSTPKCNGSPNIGRQGILKKHSSLDEEEVRRRSCSPDVAEVGHRVQEFKPILKPHRRSSLEELVRIRSPELHSILKRSKANADEHSDGGSSSAAGGGNPQGILKRQAYKTSRSHQLTTNGERHSLELPPTYYRDACFGDGGDTTVKPILKNKQHSLDAAPSEKGTSGGLMADTPRRPILKKKQLSESEQEEEQRPMKPILKSCRKSSDEEEGCVTTNQNLRSNESGRTIKPILKKNDGDYQNSRNRYSVGTRIVKSDDDCANGSHERQLRVKRHSLPG